jgi:hypothetical protein
VVWLKRVFPSTLSKSKKALQWRKIGYNNLLVLFPLLLKSKIRFSTVELTIRSEMSVQTLILANIKVIEMIAIAQTLLS